MFSLSHPPVGVLGDPKRSPLIGGSAALRSPLKADGSTTPADRDLYTTQQRGLNAELEAGVRDSCGAGNTLLEEFASVSSEWKRRWVSWMKANSSAVDQFASKTVYECETPLSREELDRRSEVTLTAEWLRQWEAAASAPMPPESRHPHFKDLHDDLLHNSLSLQEKRDASLTVKAFSSRYLHRDAFDLSALTMQAHESAHGNPLALLSAELAKSEQILSGADTAIAALQDERIALINNQCIKEAEEKTTAIVDSLDEVVRLSYSRFHQARLAAVDVEEFEDHVAQVVASTSENSSAAKKELNDLRKQSEGDSRKLADFQKKFDEEHNTLRSRFKEVGDAFRVDMQKNTDDEIDCWAIIQQQLNRLELLHNDRVRAVGGWMSAVERDREREFRYKEMSAALSDRSKALAALAAHTTEAVAYVDSIKALTASAASSAKRKDFPNRLLGKQKEEGVRFAVAFKRYSLFAARILFTKEQRLENVQRLARATEFQIQTASETLDADAPKYKMQLREMSEVGEALREATTRLSSQMDAGNPLWDEVDGFLDANNVDVDDVPLLVQELQRDLLRSHLAAVHSAVTGEQKLLDHEKAHVRKIANACSAAKDAIDNRRAERGGGRNVSASYGGGHTGPTSPITSTPQRVAAGGGASAVRAGRQL